MLTLGCMLVAPDTGTAQSAPKTILPCEWVGDIDRLKFNEPSGICFHRGRGTLFVVGDEGDLCEIKTDGTPIRQKHLRDADFEGITHDPATGLLYIAVEREEAILEFDPNSFKVKRTFRIPRSVDGRMLMKASHDGIEAITFVPDPDHAEGGTFYFSNQSFDPSVRDDISGIFELELPLRSGKRGGVDGRILRYLEVDVIDLSGMCYDPETGHLYVISDATNALLEYTREWELVGSWAFPGNDQEGIAFDGAGTFYVAQDSGGVIKFRWNRSN